MTGARRSVTSSTERVRDVIRRDLCDLLIIETVPLVGVKRPAIKQQQPVILKIVCVLRV
jgi:hypothetical protein